MKNAFMLSLCFFLFVSCSQPTERQAGPIQQSDSQVPSNAVVDEVIVVGNRRVPIETITANIQTHAGVPFNADTVKSDIEQLRSLGYFDQVSVTDGTGPTGLRRLTFEVREKPPNKVE